MGGFVGGGGLLEVRYEGLWRWVGTDPAPAPTDSPTEAADMQAAAAAVLLLAGETINDDTDDPTSQRFTDWERSNLSAATYKPCCWPCLARRRIPG